MVAVFGFRKKPIAIRVETSPEHQRLAALCWVHHGGTSKEMVML